MDENGRKHVEMIQAVISRMAANSFTLKSWSVASVTALLAFAAGTRHPRVALIALLPTVVFWLLDGYYLAQERRYRALYYDVVRVPPPGGSLSAAPPPCWDMNAQGYGGRFPVLRAVGAVWPIHGMAVLTVAIVVCALQPYARGAGDPARVQVGDTVWVRIVPAAPAGGGVRTTLPAPAGRPGGSPGVTPSTTGSPPPPGSREPEPPRPR